MQDPKVHSFTIYEPFNYPIYDLSQDHGIDWNHNTKYNRFQQFDLNEIQPTPYMANLMDEYLFNTPQVHTTSANRPKIVSVVLSPANKKETKKAKTTDKASIRSSTGCYICRLRHIKCDEKKPKCSKCLKGNLDCEFPGTYNTRPIYLTDWKAKQEKLKEIKERRKSMSSHSHSETE